MNTVGEGLRVDLVESGPGVRVRLTEAQVATLVSVPDLVRIEPAGAPGMWRLSGRRRVGAVRLGDGEGAVVLRMRPKVTVDRLLYLMGFGGGISDLRGWNLPADVTDDLVPGFAEVFARLVSRVLGAGVLHGYREREDTSAVLRGRLRVEEQMRRGFGSPIPLAVVYDDFTPDIAENRILLAAIQALLVAPGVSRRTSRTLRHQASRLVGVSRLRPGALPAWSPNRLNSRYVSVLYLAEIVLDGGGVEHRFGPVDPQGGERRPHLPGFVVDMARVFEDYLGAESGRHLGEFGLRCGSQETHHRLDRAGRIRIRPDLLVHGPDGPVCVLDVKYKDLEGGLPPTADLYQVVSYCTALGVERGHLVYAGGARRLDTHRVMGSPISVHVHVLDPSGSVADLEGRVKSLARALADGCEKRG